MKRCSLLLLRFICNASVFHVGRYQGYEKYEYDGNVSGIGYGLADGSGN